MATVNATLNGTSYSNTIGGYKINNSYSAYGGYTFNNSVNITSATIYWGAYRSSGSGNSYGNISWSFGNKSGTYNWRSSTNSSTVTTGSFTVNCSHSNFDGYFDFDISTGGDVSSCNLGVTRVIITYTNAIPSNGSITLYFNKGIVSSTTSFPSTETLTSSYNSSSGYYQAYYTLPSASATGYTFDGWSKSNDNTADVAAGTYQLFTASGTSASTTLYACWTAQTYTISYNANGGSGAPGSQTKTHNVTLTLSSIIPTKTGYEFLGWSTSPTATSATYSAGGSYTSNSSTTLYAVWKAKEYSVLYNGNGGTHSITGSETWEDTTNKFTFGKEYNISLETLGDKDFKYPGYNLLGWNTSWTATEPLTTLKIEKDEQPQLYAIWELGSNIRVYTNENWQIAIPYIYENGKWKLSISKVFNNEAWRQ